MTLYVDSDTQEVCTEAGYARGFHLCRKRRHTRANFVSEMHGDMTDIVDQHDTILTWTPAGMVAVD